MVYVQKHLQRYGCKFETLYLKSTEAIGRNSLAKTRTRAKMFHVQKHLPTAIKKNVMP